MTCTGWNEIPLQPILHRSLTSGYSVQHVEIVYWGLKDLRLSDEEAAEAITPAKLWLQRRVFGVDEADFNSDKFLMACWAMTLDPATAQRVLEIVLERRVSTQQEVELLMAEMDQQGVQPLSSGTL